MFKIFTNNLNTQDLLKILTGIFCYFSDYDSYNLHFFYCHILHFSLLFYPDADFNLWKKLRISLARILSI